MSNNKFESLLELLINEENDKAEALFHEIVVEKSRDIYENLADESTEDKVEETAEESKEDAKVDETTEEAKSDEQVDEVVEIEDEATESETTEEESIEEMGGDATDELVKDISADQEGEHDAMDKPEMDMDMDKDAEGDAEGDVEDRVVDLEDALDELKAEFEAMMGDKKDGEEDKEDESLEMPAVETQPEMSYEGKKDMMAGKKMDKEKMKEYKNPVKADHADHSDKAAKGATPVVGGSKVKTGASGSNMTQAQADSGSAGASTSINGSSTPQKMAGEFENTGGKARGTSMKSPAPKPVTADGSEKSAKSPISGK
jgi:hypothetical protein